VPSVGRGTNATRARRLIVISATDAYPAMFSAALGPSGDFEESGTDGPVTLQGGGAGRLFLSYTLPSTPQGDLGHSESAFYVVDLAAPFSRLDCEGGAFTLTIGSGDWWVPDYFAVFGVDTVNGGPRALIPFVAASAFELRQMSSDPAEGFHSMVLPTAKVLPQLPVPPEGIDPDDLGGVLAAKGVAHPENRGPRAVAVATGKAKGKVKPRRGR